jgi:hypothetical protein
MYILESIQEFDKKKIGIYRFCSLNNRQMRRAEKEIESKGIPEFAIFMLTKKITKGTHTLRTNTASFVLKYDERDGSSIIENIVI